MCLHTFSYGEDLAFGELILYYSCKVSVLYVLTLIVLIYKVHGHANCNSILQI